MQPASLDQLAELLADVVADKLADRLVDKLAHRLNVQFVPRVAYSMTDTAEALGVSLRTVERLIVGGFLTATPIGGRKVVTVAEVERFAREGIAGSIIGDDDDDSP